MFKDTGSLGKIKELIAIVVYLAQEKLREREQRDSRKDRQTETNRENSSGKKKYLYVIESNGIVLEELCGSFQDLLIQNTTDEHILADTCKC